MTQDEAIEPPAAPDGWDGARGCYNRDLSRLLREMFKYREELLARYPWVPLPSDEPSTSTPLAALLLAWKRWDLLRGQCPECGALVLGTDFGGFLSIGLISGVCTRCALVVSRRIRGIGEALQGARQSVGGTPYAMRFVRWHWGFRGIPAGLLAVLGEMGADDLPPPSSGNNDPIGGAHFSIGEGEEE